MAEFTSYDVRKLVNPRLIHDERIALYKQYCENLKITKEQLLNMMVYEHNVPEYLLVFQLRDPKDIEIDNLEDVNPPIEETVPEPVDETKSKFLPQIDYEEIRKLSLTSTDELGRDDTPDDTQEVIESLIEAVKSSQHPKVTIKEFMKYGPMNNDINTDTQKAVWCHNIVEDNELEVDILHGMYKCQCSIFSTVELICGGCEAKIASPKDAIRLPYGENGGWHPTLYCGVDCAILEPPFDITPQVQLKFLVGIEIMSRLEN